MPPPCSAGIGSALRETVLPSESIVARSSRLEVVFRAGCLGSRSGGGVRSISNESLNGSGRFALDRPAKSLHAIASEKTGSVSAVPARRRRLRRSRRRTRHRRRQRFCWLGRICRGRLLLTYGVGGCRFRGGRLLVGGFRRVGVACGGCSEPGDRASTSGSDC